MPEPGAARPAVSVVVPFRGDRAGAQATIDALGSLRPGPGDEVILVDNTPGGAVPANAPGVLVITATERRSSYHARNAGGRAARNPWLLFVDADCRPQEGLLDRYFETPPDDGAAVVAGEVVGEASQQGLLARWARSRRGMLASHHQSAWPYPAGITGNLLLRRDAWAQLGGFDESIRSAGDVELCWRAQAAGWGYSYRPEASVFHRDPDNLPEVLRQAWRYGTGRRWLRRRYGRRVGRPKLAEPLARSAGGSLVWALTRRYERAAFKLIDGLTALVTWLGYALGDNRAPRG